MPALIPGQIARREAIIRQIRTHTLPSSHLAQNFVADQVATYSSAGCGHDPYTGVS